MKNINWRSVAAIATLAALTACGSGGSDSANSSVRIVNATLTHPSLDLLVGGSVSAAATASNTVSQYVSPASGVTSLTINDAGSATALAATSPSLTGGLHYTVVAYESGGAVRTTVLNEDYATPAAGVAQIRVYNAAPDAGKLDVYITANTVTTLAGVPATLSFTTGVVPTSSLLQTEGPGAYKIWVTGYGNPADIRAVVPGVTVASQQIATVLLTPSTGGVLLNGSALIQQGVYANATPNPNVRLRLASAVSNGALVAVSATASGNTTTIDAGSAAPSFGYYTLVPASSAINTSVNSASIAAPAATLTAGSDYTLLVYGAPTTARATLIADDNRPPSDTTTTRLRMINGVTGNAGALTLTANNALVANALAAGTASGYSAVTLSTTLATTLTLTSAAQPGSFLSSATSALVPGVVYTILAAGDTAQAPNSALGPQFLIR